MKKLLLSLVVLVLTGCASYPLIEYTVVCTVSGRPVTFQSDNVTVSNGAVTVDDAERGESVTFAQSECVVIKKNRLARPASASYTNQEQRPPGNRL